MPKRKLAKARYEARDALFTKFYVEGKQPDFGPGNAYQSARAAGYAHATARSNSHIIAARNITEISRAFRLLGADEFFLAKKILALTQATAVRWNPSKGGTRKKPKGGWDKFEDNATQLGATKELGRFLNAYPAPKEEGTDSRPIEFIFPANFAGLMEDVDAPTEGRSSG